jgi:hypothetical protein
MLEAGATKGRYLRLEVRRILSGASRERHRDVVWLSFKAPHRYLVDVTVTSPRTNTNVPHTEIGIVHNNTGKLDRPLSIGPLYLAIQDL